MGLSASFVESIIPDVAWRDSAEYFELSEIKRLS